MKTSGFLGKQEREKVGNIDFKILNSAYTTHTRTHAAVVVQLL